MDNIKLDLQDHLRASDVIRWNIVATARHQSMAEHTFNVIMIARDMAKTMGLDIANITEIALNHDLHEIVDGDLPTPTKERLRKYNINWGGNDTDTRWIDIYTVKCADIMEAIWFLEGNRIGRHAMEVQEDLVELIDSIINNPETPKGLVEAIQGVNYKMYQGDLTR